MGHSTSDTFNVRNESCIEEMPQEQLAQYLRWKHVDVFSRLDKLSWEAKQVDEHDEKPKHVMSKGQSSCGVDRVRVLWCAKAYSQVVVQGWQERTAALQWQHLCSLLPFGHSPRCFTLQSFD